MSGLQTKSSNQSQKDFGPAPAPAAQAWSRPIAANRQVVQLVNRITFGSRPGDLERVRAMGVRAFLDQQLHPERLDDSALQARLKSLHTLSMSTGELLEKYPQPKQLGQPGIGQARPASSESMKASGADAMSMSAGGTGQADNGPREILIELGRQELLRSVYSSRQLQEVMVQFWMNHFNVFAGKGADKWMLTSFERDTIRPHALGKFEDLLVATAKSPAMLFYLDNWMSATPSANAGNVFARRSIFGGAGRFGSGFGPANARLGQSAPGGLKRGLNENYGRELMELHTLGVNGGYTQQDVIEVARCLTGWTIRRPRFEAEFFFNPQLHDEGPKTVLGHTIAAGGGMEDGLQVLHLLATHPATAHFISLKLCRRFVSDEPSASLVDRTSQEFSRTRGDLRAVLGTVLTSPEFYSESAYRAKVKSPLEMVASALRALDAETDAGPLLMALIGRMGEPMFLYQAPAGFPDRSSTWISSSALLARLNFAAAMASNRIPGTQIDWGRALSQDGGQNNHEAGAASPAAMVDELDSRLTGGALSPASRGAIMNSLQNRQPDAAAGAGTAGSQQDPFTELSTVAALVIGSPEFQWR